MEDVSKGRDHGRIAPDKYGKWRWPFSEMAEWDWFTVDTAQRPLAKIKSLCATRGNQIGRRFRAVLVGHNVAHVRRIGVDPTLPPHKAQAYLDHSYGEGAFDAISLEEVDVRSTVKRQCIGQVPQCMVLDNFSTLYGFRFHRQGFTIEPLVCKPYEWLAVNQLLD